MVIPNIYEFKKSGQGHSILANKHITQTNRFGKNTLNCVIKELKM